VANVTPKSRVGAYGDECCWIITDQNAPTLPLTASMKAEAYHAESFDSKLALHYLIAAVWSTFFPRCLLDLPKAYELLALIIETIVLDLNN
jgi:hypothetical protein